MDDRHDDDMDDYDSEEHDEGMGSVDDGSRTGEHRRSVKANWQEDEFNNVDATSNVTPFLQKTYAILNNPSNSAYISWIGNDGRFRVFQQDMFSTKILPLYFKHNNFSSFVRQLHTYGFRKVDAESWTFKHDDFRPGQPALLARIRRKKPDRHGEPGSGTGSHLHHPSGAPAAPHHHPHAHVASSKPIEVGRFGSMDDLESLRRDRDTLRQELIRMRQQQDTMYEILLENQRRQKDTDNRVGQLMDNVGTIVNFLQALFKNSTQLPPTLRGKRARSSYNQPLQIAWQDVQNNLGELPFDALAEVNAIDTMTPNSPPRYVGESPLPPRTSTPPIQLGSAGGSANTSPAVIAPLQQQQQAKQPLAAAPQQTRSASLAATAMNTAAAAAVGSAPGIPVTFGTTAAAVEPVPLPRAMDDELDTDGFLNATPPMSPSFASAMDTVSDVANWSRFLNDMALSNGILLSPGAPGGGSGGGGGGGGPGTPGPQ